MTTNLATTQSPTTKPPVGALNPQSFVHDPAFVAKLASRADHLADYARALQQATPGTPAWDAAATALVDRCANWSGPWVEQGDALHIHPADAARVLSWLDCRNSDPALAKRIRHAQRLRADLDRGAAVLDDQAPERRLIHTCLH